MKFLILINLITVLNLYGQIYSKLWGVNGESWTPESRLLDFSEVGFEKGDKAIPEWAVKINVMKFGAKGDGKHDDREAIIKAIEACPPKGAVYFPDGAYLISDWIKVNKSQIVLRGQSREKTILYFPKGLNEIRPMPTKNNSGLSTSEYSWGYGFFLFESESYMGIENFTFKFPDKPYPGHFKENGYNGIQFQKGAKNCWAVNLKFYNCDSGIYANSSSYITIQDTVFDAYKGRGNMTGHHGITAKRSHHILVNEFDFKVKMYHELSLEFGSNMCVWSNGKGIQLHFDHHQPPPNHPYKNLFTNIDVGDPKLLWRNNAKGSTDGEVYWNIKASKRIPYPVNSATRNNTFVAFQGVGKPAPNKNNYVEIIPNDKVLPKNIYEAQLNKRREN